MKFRQKHQKKFKYTITGRDLYPVNQCDGCNRGLEIRQGVHVDTDGFYKIECTKDRYITGREVYPVSHTKEPWRTQYENSYPEDTGHWIYNCKAGADEHAIAVTFALNPQAEQDSRRIVACVNACAGIPTEQLESEGTDVFLNHLARAKLEQQNAELVAAITEHKRRTMIDCTLNQIMPAEYDCALWEAIAKSEAK